MRLGIKDFHSPDIDSIWSWQPDQAKDVYFLLQFNIGPIGSRSADMFQVMIATPEGLRACVSQPTDSIALSDRATLILKEYSWHGLLRELSRIIERCSANNWTESALRLQRYFQWEYEDFITDGSLH